MHFAARRVGTALAGAVKPRKMLANEHKARRVDTKAGSALCRPYRGCERLCSLHPVPYDTGKGYADPPGLMIRLAKASSSFNLSYRL